jgi:hypothetical protein
MKWILRTFAFFVLICLGLIFLPSANEAPIIEEIRAEVNIKFGRGPNCTGRGSCSLAQPDGKQNTTFDSSGELYVNAGGNLVLEIDKSSMTVQMMEEQFVEGMFLMEENLVIPESLGEAINSGPSGSVIQAGIYPVQNFPDYFLIQF